MADDESTWFKPAVFAYNPRVEPHWQTRCDDCGLAPTREASVTLIRLGDCCYREPYLCLPCLKKRVAGLEGGA